MTAEQLVKSFYQEKEALLDVYFNKRDNSAVGVMIKELNLPKEQEDKLYNILNFALTDVMYTILLGLDGEASIGQQQVSFKLFDEQNNELTGDGKIEAYAWQYFHGQEG